MSPQAILDQEREARRVDAKHYYQLTGCVAQYTSVNIILWTIFSIFAAAHAVLVGALVPLLDEPERHQVGGIVVSIVGLGAAFAWALLLRRTVGHLRWHESLVDRIEHDLGIEKERGHQMFPARIAAKEPGDDIKLPTSWRFFNTSEPSRADDRGYGPAAKLFMQRCTWWVFVGWYFTLLYFVIRVIGFVWPPT